VAALSFTSALSGIMNATIYDKAHRNSGNARNWRPLFAGLALRRGYKILQKVTKRVWLISAKFWRAKWHASVFAPSGFRRDTWG
jgi:GT2 family glycosyltransferase